MQIQDWLLAGIQVVTKQVNLQIQIRDENYGISLTIRNSSN